MKRLDLTLNRTKPANAVWLALIVLVFELTIGFGAAVAQSCPEEGSTCASLPHTFSPTDTDFVYNFGNDSLEVRFREVLTTFTLTVTRVENAPAPTASQLPAFPAGTVCVQFSTGCTRYDISGSAGGPNGVPQKNTDYKGLITYTLVYFSSFANNNPAFGHSPGDTDPPVFSEDILTNYSIFPQTPDPTMDGTSVTPSSLIALAQPLTQNDNFCWVSPATDGQSYPVGTVIEVSFQLFAGSSCSGTPIRDKNARMSLVRDPNTNRTVFQPFNGDEASREFHFQLKEGVNERELPTKGLTPGNYGITIFSDKFGPQSRTFTLQ